MGPVCTLMVGRLDDHLKAVAEKENIIANPEMLDWAGVAVMKKAYQIYNAKRLSSTAVKCSFQKSPALVRIHRRKCCNLTSLALAEKI